MCVSVYVCECCVYVCMCECCVFGTLQHVLLRKLCECVCAHVYV